MAHRMGDANPDKTLRAAFGVFDQNGDGTIDANELRSFIRECGEAASEEEIDRVFGDIDENGDGRIDYEEFSRTVTEEMMTSGFSIT